MPSGFEFRTQDTQLLQFSSARAPYVFLGKVSVGPNAGTLLRTTAYQQDVLAPDFNPPVELVQINVPLGSVQVAITGDKLPICLTMMDDASGVARCSFRGVRSGSCTLYFFGPHNGSSRGGAQPNFELYNPDTNKLIMDAYSRPMQCRSGMIDWSNDTAIPSGKVWGGIIGHNGIMDNGTFNWNTSFGVRQFQRYSFSTVFSNGSIVGPRFQVRDVFQNNTSSEGGIIRPPRYMVVDVTGL